MTATISTEASVARARQLLHSAAEASKQLEGSVRDLVAMRAWEVLGYEAFSAMWEGECGFKCPTHVEVLAVSENAKTRSDAETAKDIFPSYIGNRGHYVRGILAQLDAGVPSNAVIKSHPTAPATVAKIARYNSGHHIQARPRRRRMGALPSDFVPEGFNIQRELADQIADIARQADVPKAEIYRVAVAEYLARYRESRPGAAS